MYDDLVFYALVSLLFLPGLILVGLFGLSYLTPWPRRNGAYFRAKRPIYRSKQRSQVSNSEEIPFFPQLLLQDRLRPSKPDVYLSVVIPAMNEEYRLPMMLTECCEYLSERQEGDPKFTYEVIVVDDGSKDGTARVAHLFTLAYPIFVCKLPENIGKGGAVRNGVLCARGQIILFADADGATTFNEIAKLEKELRVLCNGHESMPSEPIDWTHPGLVVGSRAHLEKQSIAKRSLLRTILMVGFHSVVYTFAVRSVRDTQCGFKMFSRAAAAQLFPRLHIERWAFDVELLYLAEALNFSISEVAVQWREIDGSKVTPFFSWLQMGRDIVLIWFRYLFKVWRTDEPVD